MTLADLPLLFVLIGLALYTLLAGADFGAGFWQLTAGSGTGGEAIREHAHEAVAPVWEANHVWLIFVLTVLWTAYPTAFGSIASTLSIPLFVAAIGIIFRGAAYALHSGAAGTRERRVIDTAFSLSSILTPAALGAAVGGIASGRVPVGNAKGDLVASWLNPTSLLVGTLSVALGSYLSAVYLCADARRQGRAGLEAAFRRRAVGAGVLAGVLALLGLGVLRVDAAPLYLGLVSGDGLVGLVVSLLAGVGTLALVGWRRFELARYSAAVAVVAIIAGWALAQRPFLLPGLTVTQAAAPADTLVAVVVAVLAGAVILFPSLGLLFRLVLRGRFDPGRTEPAPAEPAPAEPAPAGPPGPSPRVGRAGWPARSALACLLAGIGLLTAADAGWAHTLGVLSLLGFVALGFLAAAPADLAEPLSQGRR
jgi:cytochrome d ubiquinol oxidase subunit II